MYLDTPGSSHTLIEITIYHKITKLMNKREKRNTKFYLVNPIMGGGGLEAPVVMGAVGSMPITPGGGPGLYTDSCGAGAGGLCSCGTRARGGALYCGCSSPAVSGWMF